MMVGPPERVRVPCKEVMRQSEAVDNANLARDKGNGEGVDLSVQPSVTFVSLW